MNQLLENSAGPETKMRLMMELLMGMLILSIPCHLLNNMITEDHLYSPSSVQYYLFCRAGDEEDEDDGAADGYVDIVYTLSFVEQYDHR